MIYMAETKQIERRVPYETKDFFNFHPCFPSVNRLADVLGVTCFHIPKINYICP